MYYIIDELMNLLALELELLTGLIVDEYRSPHTNIDKIFMPQISSRYMFENLLMLFLNKF